MSMIRKATAAELDVVTALAGKLWPNHPEKELEKELISLLTNDAAVIFIARDDGKAIAFAQCQLRYDYVEGARTSPVGYLEGIWVDPNCRRRGIAGELLQNCESWAKEKGCAEFASDCEIKNFKSLKFHLQHGFNEANRIVCLIKKIG